MFLLFDYNTNVGNLFDIRKRFDKKFLVKGKFFTLPL